MLRKTVVALTDPRRDRVFDCASHCIFSSIFVDARRLYVSEFMTVRFTFLFQPS